MNDLSAEQIIKKYQTLKANRTEYNALYQILHTYFYVESNNLIDRKNPKIHTLLDSTSLDCADVLSAGLSNYLTPENKVWMCLEHVDRDLRLKPAVIKWMASVTDEVLFTLSQSNFYNQMPIFYKASGVYGTATLFCESDGRDGVRFYNLPIFKSYISEDARERPDAFFLEFDYTADQVFSKFGIEMSPNEMHRFICYIGERKNRNSQFIDKKNMPVRMVWIYEKTKQIIAEDGFLSMPCVAHRFYKQAQNVYGQSPAMKALPYVRLVNTMTDTFLRSAMKQADPAICLPDDAFLGIPNFNPRQINYYVRGKLSPKEDIFPVGNFGNPAIALETLQYYQAQIRTLMFYDTFQAFVGLTQQMTVAEVTERINEKMTMLAPAVGRLMNDVLQPLIQKVVLILMQQGKLPPFPKEMEFDKRFKVVRVEE